MTRYSPKFFKQTPQREWKRMLSKLQFKLGRIQGFELVRWNYGTRSDAAGAGTYVVLEYTVNYAKHPAHETLTVFKPKGGQFGIPGHNINSAGLLLE